jgi:hypothetical protein
MSTSISHNGQDSTFAVSGPADQDLRYFAEGFPGVKFGFLKQPAPRYYSRFQLSLVFSGLSLQLGIYSMDTVNACTYEGEYEQSESSENLAQHRYLRMYIANVRIHTILAKAVAQTASGGSTPDLSDNRTNAVPLLNLSELS